MLWSRGSANPEYRPHRRIWDSLYQGPTASLRSACPRAVRSSPRNIPHAHGARILQDALPADARTIAHHFAEHGYQTGAIGKMHFVDETQKHGFDYRLEMADFKKTLTDEEWRELRRDQGGNGGTSGRPSNLSARYFQDAYYADETVRYLREKRSPDKPFVLWSSYFMPHTPLVPMRDYFDRYDPDTLALPKRSPNALETGFEGHLIRAKQRGWYAQTDAELGRALAGYYGNISQMDACIGHVLDALYDLGLDENTIIVYTSDHGEMAGAHRMWTKHNMYEQSVRVPLIIRLPGDVDRNAACDHLIEHVDLYPTLAELCGLPLPENIHGRSFAPLLCNRPLPTAGIRVLGIRLLPRRFHARQSVRGQAADSHGANRPLETQLFKLGTL